MKHKKTSTEETLYARRYTNNGSYVQSRYLQQMCHYSVYVACISDIFVLKIFSVLVLIQFESQKK
jgi:hypothetical protein